MPRGARRLTIGLRSAAALAVAALLLVAGAHSAPATVASKRLPRRCAPGVTGAVSDAYATVFSRNDTSAAPARAARLQDGSDPALESILVSWLADPSGRSTTVAVNTVRCTSARRATVDADLVLSGEAMNDVLPRGTAVLDGGTWKVSRTTFCARMILENPALASNGACATR